MNNTNSVFGLDDTDRTNSKSKMKSNEPRSPDLTGENSENPNVFKKYEKNEAFPIHATFDDS